MCKLLLQPLRRHGRTQGTLGSVRSSPGPSQPQEEPPAQHWVTVRWVHRVKSIRVDAYPHPALSHPAQDPIHGTAPSQGSLDPSAAQHLSPSQGNRAPPCSPAPLRMNGAQRRRPRRLRVLQHPTRSCPSSGLTQLLPRGRWWRQGGGVMPPSRKRDPGHGRTGRQTEGPGLQRRKDLTFKAGDEVLHFGIVQEKLQGKRGTVKVNRSCFPVCLGSRREAQRSQASPSRSLQLGATSAPRRGGGCPATLSPRAGRRINWGARAPQPCCL